ncbi:MAG TPA: GAF domain-containing protein [Phototrophicaceae bacterium]|nr:GAF domain-containing protein [Phototrophicaceae bacterium]
MVVFFEPPELVHMQIAHQFYEEGRNAIELLEALFDQMVMGIVILDPAFRIQRFNSTWTNYFEQYAPARMDSVHPGAGYFDLLPEIKPILEPVFTAVLNGETAHEQAVRISHGASTTYWNFVATPLLDAEVISGILLVCTDVTEQIEARQRLQTALDELKRSHELIEQRVDERTRELKTLVTVQQALTSSLEYREILQVIACEARRLTQTDVGALFLPEKDGLVLAALSSEEPLDMEVGYQISLSDSISGTTFLTGKKQLVTDITHYPHVDPNAIRKAQLQSILCVPLLSGTKVIGVLSVGNKVSSRLDAEDERLLMLMVPSAVIALENGRMYELARETAIAAERGRLARDLHDAVTQTLFSASLTAEVLPHIWARDPAEGMVRLEKLRELTRGALAEMRTLLLELRPAALEEIPLGDLLRQLVEGIAGRTHIAIEIVDTCECELCVEVKTAFYRIAQEALNNVAKHSKARSARILLTGTHHQVSLTISDDGIGFDPWANRANHLGLKIMVERADAIKATLSVNSIIGQGTQIIVSWPGQEV